MSNREYRLSPLAQSQLIEIWLYGCDRFGEAKADVYVGGLLSALEEASATGRYKGLPLREVPADRIRDITTLRIRFMHYERHYIYVRNLPKNALGVVCILGDRMDTPRRLKEMLAYPLSDPF